MVVTRARVSCLAVVAVAALAGAGCGGSDEEDVETTARDFLTALRDEDFDGTCEALTEQSREQLAQVASQAGGDCAAFFEQQAEMGGLGGVPEPEAVDADSIEVDGDSATAEIEGDEARLRKQDGEWKIDFVGESGGGESGGGEGEGEGGQGGG